MKDLFKALLPLFLMGCGGTIVPMPDALNPDASEPDTMTYAVGPVVSPRPPIGLHDAYAPLNKCPMAGDPCTPLYAYCTWSGAIITCVDGHWEYSTGDIPCAVQCQESK